MRKLTVYFDYDIKVMTSYALSDYVDKLWPDSVESYEEIRDSGGLLKQIKVTVLLD